MRFLVNNNLSPALVEHFRAGGHEAVDVRTYTLQSAPDEVVLQRAGRRAGAHLGRYDLTAGAVVILSDNRLRIRRLALPPM